MVLFVQARLIRLCTKSTFDLSAAQPQPERSKSELVDGSEATCSGGARCFIALNTLMAVRSGGAPCGPCWHQLHSAPCIYRTEGNLDIRAVNMLLLWSINLG